MLSGGFPSVRRVRGGEGRGGGFKGRNPEVAARGSSTGERWGGGVEKKEELTEERTCTY